MTTQTHDIVTETKQCQHCGSSFDITQSDMDFYAKISPKFGDYVAQIPTPTLCPDCRQRRRLSFRNERKLYRRICDASQQPIISIYSPDKPHKVYDQKIRWSDARDALDYGRDFDFSRTFAEQFGEMMREVPRLGIMNDDGMTSTNCGYTNDFLYGKDCYMCDTMGECESCYYAHHCNGAKDIIDCSNSHHCANSYQVVDSIQSYQCTHSLCLYNSNNCHWSSFLIGCHHCLLCSGLENQSYCYMNQAITEEEFMSLLKRAQSDPVRFHAEYEKYLHNVFDTTHNDNIRNSSHCTGKNITDSSNLSMCYNATKSQNSKYAHILYDAKECMDITCRKSELCLEGQVLDESFKSGFCDCVTKSNHTFYSNYCYYSSHLFGCIGLRNKEYCIFNKQYTKEEYNALVPQIIEHMKKTGEWGEFFHPSLSLFGYNETVAQEYFPAEEGELDALGYHRSNYEAPQPQVDKVIPGEKLPAQGCAIIQEKKPVFLQDILKYAIRCEKSQKLFRLIPQEIAFYTKHNLPLPRRHPDVRHAERMEMRRGT